MARGTASCDVCGGWTSTQWSRCGACGAQRLLDRRGTPAGFAPFAPFWRRLVATGLDAALFVVPVILLRFLPSRITAPGGTAEEALPALIILIALLYFPLCLGSSGRTLGKRLLGLIVVDDRGAPLDFPQAATRDGLGLLLFAIFPVVLLVAAIQADAPIAQRIGMAVIAIGAGTGWALLPAAFTARRQTTYDVLSATVVVRAQPVAEPLQPAADAADTAAVAPTFAVEPTA